MLLRIETHVTVHIVTNSAIKQHLLLHHWVSSSGFLATQTKMDEQRTARSISRGGRR